MKSPTLTMLALTVLLSLGCNQEHEAVSQLPPPSLQKVTMHATDSNDPTETYELILHFDRALTQDEVTPAWQYRHQYGLKVWLYSRTGWSSKPWGVAPVQAGLMRGSNTAYLLTSESSHHPIRSYSDEVDRAFEPDNLSKVSIELYERDKENATDYTLIQRAEFTPEFQDPS